MATNERQIEDGYERSAALAPTVADRQQQIDSRRQRQMGSSRRQRQMATINFLGLVAMVTRSTDGNKVPVPFEPEIKRSSLDSNSANSPWQHIVSGLSATCCLGFEASDKAGGV
ncbi:hypothetical protein Pint_12222 [Pistacia integerrima]|nr:hypothetical protein Pint_12222 [Pistacia integerrima]